MMKKKGAAKGGVRKMRGGGMAKGAAKGGVNKMKDGGKAMTVAQLRSAAKAMGMKVVNA